MHEPTDTTTAMIIVRVRVPPPPPFVDVEVDFVVVAFVETNDGRTEQNHELLLDNKNIRCIYIHTYIHAYTYIHTYIHTVLYSYQLDSLF